MLCASASKLNCIHNFGQTFIAFQLYIVFRHWLIFFGYLWIECAKNTNPHCNHQIVNIQQGSCSRQSIGHAHAIVVIISNLMIWFNTLFWELFRAKPWISRNSNKYAYATSFIILYCELLKSFLNTRIKKLIKNWKESKIWDSLLFLDRLIWDVMKLRAIFTFPSLFLCQV